MFAQSFRAWVNQLRRGRISSPRAMRSRRPAHLAPELLEDRLVPALTFSAAPDASWLTPPEVRDVYGFNDISPFTANGRSYAADGSGQTIGIIDLGGEPNLARSLQTFDKQYGIQPLDGQNGDGWLKQVNLDGSPGNLVAGRGDGTVETDLDVEWAHAIAPGANIVVVEVPSSRDPAKDPNGRDHAENPADYRTAAQTAVNMGASAISISISFGATSTQDPTFSFGGVTVLSASGDNGTFTQATGGPSTVDVGGTMFINSAGGLLSGSDLSAYPAEVAWEHNKFGTGGGFYPSQNLLPSWQSAAAANVASQLNETAPSVRMAPDVSMVAENLAEVDYTDGGPTDQAGKGVTPTPWTVNNGTSFATPMWAGLVALVNQGRALELPTRGPLNGIDPTLPMLYNQLAVNDFHDISPDSYETASELVGDPSTPGYDTATGLGTPRADQIVPDLIAPYTGYFAQVEGSVLVIATNQNGGNDLLNIGVKNLPQGQYLEVTDNDGSGTVTDDFPVGSFTSIAVYTRNASDTVNLNSTPGKVTTTIQLGGGTDTVNLTPVSEQLSKIAGSVTVYGGNGSTALNVYDDKDAAANNNYYLSANSLSGTAIPTVSFSGIQTTDIEGGIGARNSTIAYHVGVNRDGTVAAPPAGPANESITLSLNGQNLRSETVDVVSTSGPTTLTIDLASGSDTVNLSPKDHLLTELFGGVTVVGANGAGTLNVHDEANEINGTYTLSSDELTRSFWNTSVLFTELGTVNVYGGPGAGVDGSAGSETYRVGDFLNQPFAPPSAPLAVQLYTTGQGSSTVNVEDTPAAMALTLHLLSSSNTVAISPSTRDWAAVQGRVDVEGGTGTTTTLTINDLNDPNNVNYFVTSHSAAIDFSNPVTYNGVASVSLYGSAGNQYGGENYHVGTGGAGGPTPPPAGDSANVYLSVYTAGTLAERIDILDEVYADGNGTLHNSLEGFANVSVNGHSADTLVIDNSQAPTLPSKNDFANPQTYTIAPGSVKMLYTYGSSTPRTRTNFTTTANVTYSGPGWVEVDGGQAGEQFDIGDGKSNLDLLPAKVDINGLPGDGLTVNNAPDPASIFSNETPQFTIQNGDISWVIPATVTLGTLSKNVSLNDVVDYSGVTNLEVDGGKAPSTFWVESTPAGSSLTIKDGTRTAGDARTDQVTVGGTGGPVGGVPLSLAGVLGNLTVHGQGNTNLTVNDGATTAGEQYVVGASSVAWAVAGTPTVPTRITYDGVAGLELDGAAGGNVVTVGGRTAGTTTTVKAGAGADTVRLTGARAAYVGPLTVDGQGGVNTLDYSGFRGAVTVNLPLATATAVAGGIANVRNVTGGIGNDLFVGDGTGNVLKGGSGRNILIAGAAPGTLSGQSGEDVLVGGSTSYDTDPTALAALMAEWTANVPYQTRVANLLQGGPGSAPALSGAVGFTNNGGGNTLTGAAGLDLFYGIKAADANDWNAAINEVFIENSTPVSFKIDAHALTLPTLLLDGGTLINTQSIATVNVLPGYHTLAENDNGYFNAAPVTFRVLVDGTVTFGSQFASVLGGQGTNTLVVKGTTIMIDARALATPRLTVDVTYSVATANPFPLTLLPGPQEFIDTWGTGSVIPFTVAANGSTGSVGYESQYAGLLSGQGTPTLTANGLSITIDARALSSRLLTVDVSRAFPTTGLITMNVLPGPQSLWDYYAGDRFNFSVLPNGTIDYGSPEDEIFSGRTTRTLTVTGETVTIDPRNLSLNALVVDSSIVEPMTSVFTLHLLPGDHTLTDNYGWSAPLTFTVGYAGTVSYSSVPVGVFTGNGTSAAPLVLEGLTLTVDATAIDSQVNYYSVATAGGLATTQVQTLQVLPGSFQLTAGSEQVTFDLSAQYGLSYTMSPDGTLGGSGTDRLTVLE